MNTIRSAFTVKEITIYPNQARIRRMHTLPLKKGENSLVITQLPEIITEESVRIEPQHPGRVKIVDITAKDEFIEQYDDNRYRQELEKIEELVSAQQKLEARFRNYSDEFLLFLNKEKLSDMDPELRKRQMIIKNWEEFLPFVRTRLEANREEVRSFIFEWIELKRKQEAAEANLEKLRSYGRTKEHTIVVNVEASDDMDEEFHLLYLQPGVSWYPAYNIRADLEAMRISVNLFGMISQQTGEDWENVELLLSTAIPMHNCSIPEVKSKKIKEQETQDIILEPASVMIAQEEMMKISDEADSLMDYGESDMPADMKRRERVSSGKLGLAAKTVVSQPKKKVMEVKAEMPAMPPIQSEDKSKQKGKKAKPEEKPGYVGGASGIGAFSGIDTLSSTIDDRISAPSLLNMLSSYYTALYNHLRDSYSPDQIVPVSGEIRFNKAFAQGVPLEQSIGGFDYRYRIESKQKLLPSSATPIQVSVDIKELAMELVYVTVPLEKEAVYLKASFSNTFNNPFPAGPAQVFVENNFLGNIGFPTLGTAKGTSISLGVEQDIKVVRKQKSERKTGGMVKKEITTCYTVEIELVSYKNKPVTIEVLDRMPYSPAKTDVSVTDAEYTPKPALVTDDNIIIFREELVPGKKKMITFSYTIKHPEDFRMTLQKGNYPYTGK